MTKVKKSALEKVSCGNFHRVLFQKPLMKERAEGGVNGCISDIKQVRSDV